MDTLCMRRFTLLILHGFKLYLRQKKRNYILGDIEGSHFSHYLILWISIVKSELCLAHSFQTLGAQLQTLGILPPPPPRAALLK